MPGGLIEIVTYGSQDLYLTGSPEITFFKVVYRRHTNFAMESIRVSFDDNVGFGSTSHLTVPKVGDLVHKMYLEIVLPRINLKRDDSSLDLKPALDETIANLEIVTDFLSINRTAYVNAFDIFVAENNSNTEAIINSVRAVFSEPGAVDTINSIKNLLAITINAPFLYDEISMDSIISAFNIEDSKEDVFNAMTVGTDKSIKTQDFYFTQFKDARAAHLDESNDNIKFAWVSRIGHAIIDEIEIMIGGSKVERQWGEWLNIWYELTANRSQEEIYFKLIGNVDELTSFDRKAKPKYLLKIPLQFWFNRYNGMALPLVALEYQDVTIQFKFRKIEDVAYIEQNKRIFVSDTQEKLFLDEVPNELDINIDATLLIDYIYLDSPERRRFAQASHEYLIDQLQMLEITNITQPVTQIVLNNFVHPSKEIIWIAQKKSYTINLDGYHKNQWDNYSLTEGYKGNPIRYSTINFHSYNRVPRYDGSYFNYVQPYQHHKTTPTDGVNMYSFSISPEEAQPSGSANFSRLSNVLLILEFDNSLFDVAGVTQELNVRIYSRNTNILRFLSGMAAPSFTYG